jgi:Uma2 family endonuclease
MAVNVHPVEFKLVRNGDNLEIDLLPLQGLWTEQQYLKLTDQTAHLIEFSDGEIELLPMPTDRHQAISQFLFLALLQLVRQTGGKVQYAPLRLRIREGKYREPDLLVVLDAKDPRRQNAFWLGADLVIEVVSPDDAERDTRVKRLDYAEAGIPEYWIVNPEDETITVLTLGAGAAPEGRQHGAIYAEHGVYHRGETATSRVIGSLAVQVTHVFDAS